MAVGGMGWLEAGEAGPRGEVAVRCARRGAAGVGILVAYYSDMHTGRRIADFDPRNQPAYSFAEASRYLKVPSATLRSWIVGRHYQTTTGDRHFSPLILSPDPERGYLSFWNLVEAHVLRALRTDHGVAVREVRAALDYAEKCLGIDRLLLRQELSTDAAGRLFLDRYGELIRLSASGQLAMRQMLHAHLRRVDWDSWHFPVRLYPFTAAERAASEMPIVIDPEISFGRPVVRDAFISTSIIARRIDAGESTVDLADDYGVTTDQIEQAVLYEHAA